MTAPTKKEINNYRLSEDLRKAFNKRFNKNARGFYLKDDNTIIFF